MRHPLMNLVNTTLPQKYGDPLLKVSIYGSVLKCSLYTPMIAGQPIQKLDSESGFVISQPATN